MFRQQFAGELVLIPLPDGRRWKVSEDFRYETDAGLIITVPAGRITDLASVPRILWAIYPPFGRYTRAAVIHDDLYDGHRRRKARYSRMYADAIFYEAMRDCIAQMPTTTWRQRCWKSVWRMNILVLWLAVRLGARPAWTATP